jgi:hypothetical protein
MNSKAKILLYILAVPWNAKDFDTGALKLLISSY